jgi:3-oxoacyl-[acyl-carrier-protein] synthase III
MASVTGLGTALPERELVNSELAERFDVSEEWIFERTGIRSRRIAGEDETASSLATKAAAAALESAGMEGDALDLIIVATITSDYQFPATACLVQSALGARSAGAFDLGAGCSGWLFALAQATALVDSGAAQRVLVCGADVLARFTDYSDLGSSVLFGDGAGAAIVENIEGRSDLGRFRLHSDGAEPDLLCIPKGSRFIQMRGREVYRRAVDAMTAAVEEAMIANDVKLEERPLLVAHQANARILEAVQRRLGWPQDRVAMNIDRVGNTSSASIPLVLHAAVQEGLLTPGDLVVLTAFGTGFAWGSGVMTWSLPVTQLVEHDASVPEVAGV